MRIGALEQNTAEWNDLSFPEIAVLLFLASRTDKVSSLACYPSIKTISQKLRISKHRVIKTLASLEKKQRISILHPTQKGNGNYNFYNLIPFNNNSFTTIIPKITQKKGNWKVNNINTRFKNTP